MADPESSTLIVNGCLFLNVASFRYLDFEQDAEGAWRFTLLRRRLDARARRTSRTTSEEASPAAPTCSPRSRRPTSTACIALDDEDDED